MQIFLLAERLRVSGADIGDAGYASAAPTVRLAFKRILLVSILHPYRLQPGEAWALFDYLRQTADLARLSQFRQRDKTEGCFLVPVRGPVRHLHYDSSSLPEESEQMLLLDTTSLNVRAYQDLSTIKSGRSDPASLFGALGRHGTERLLHTLLVNWHLRPRRRHARQERYNWVVAACGLDAIREYLEREQAPNRSDTGTPEQMEETIHIVDRMPGIRTREHETHRWRQIDISSSGIALTLPADEVGTLEVGQLILVTDDDSSDDRRWHVGVVRRVIQRDMKHFEAGVQFVQGRIRAASIRPEVFGSEQASDFQSALLLERGPEQSPVVFTPHMLYREHHEYLVETGGEACFRINSGALLESTLCYERFEYAPIRLHG